MPRSRPLKKSQGFSLCLCIESVTVWPVLDLHVQLLVPSVPTHTQCKLPPLFQRLPSSQDFAFAIAASYMPSSAPQTPTNPSSGRQTPPSSKSQVTIFLVWGASPGRLKCPLYLEIMGKVAYLSNSHTGKKVLKPSLTAPSTPVPGTAIGTQQILNTCS